MFSVINTYKYSVLTTQSKSNTNKICAIEKISSTYYLKQVRKKYKQQKLVIIVSLTNL